MWRSYLGGKNVLRLVVAGAVLGAALPADSRDREIETYLVEIGKGSEIVARTELRVAGEDHSRFSRVWPFEGTDSCITDKGVRRFAVAGNIVTIVLEPLDRQKAARGTIRPMRITGEWRIYRGMPGGLDSVDCEAYPKHGFSSKVSRTIDMDETPVAILAGDDGLFVKVTRL